MKFKMRLIQEFEAEDETAAQEFIMNEIRNGMKHECAIEILHEKSPEEIEEATQVSFKDLLNNLNSGDMTKN